MASYNLAKQVGDINENLSQLDRNLTSIYLIQEQIEKKKLMR